MTRPRLPPFIAVSVLSWLMVGGSPLLAQAGALVADAPPRPPTLSSSERAAALSSIQDAIRRTYVFPDKTAGIVGRLDEARKAGRYETDNPRTLAESVTEDLRAVSGDRHLYMLYDPAQYAAAQRTATQAPDAGEAGSEAYQRRLAIRDHHGLSEMKIFPGNIRYLKITEFKWVNDDTGRAYDGAMRFLKDGDAVIIDVRSNPGGSHAAVRYLVSHFLEGDTLEFTFLAGVGTPSQSRTLEYLPAGRLEGKPLYVLIDGHTGSASEAFAYDVQQFKLGELIGAKTAGAANNNNLLPIAPGFMLSVSFGRPVHAVSQGNWDGVGIKPDVEIPPAHALETAQSLALTRLTATPGASSENLAAWRWAQVGVEARLHPLSLPPARLKTLVGRYGGKFTVSFHDGTLWLDGGKNPSARLSPLTSDGLFAVEGYETLRVRLTGRLLEMLWSDEPAPRAFART